MFPLILKDWFLTVEIFLKIMLPGRIPCLCAVVSVSPYSAFVKKLHVFPACPVAVACALVDCVLLASCVFDLKFLLSWCFYHSFCFVVFIETINALGWDASQLYALKRVLFTNYLMDMAFMLEWSALET